MDLFSIIREVRKNKVVVLPVLLITLALAAYVAVGRPNTYQSQSSVVFTAAAPPPTAQQIAADPSLAKLDSTNPYAQYSDLTVVAALVEELLSSPAAGDHFKAEGVDPSSSITQSPLTSAPILDVTGVGATPALAQRSARLIDQQAITSFDNLQAAHGVAKPYWVGAEVLTAPGVATVQVSGKLRQLIAVIAFGVIILFVALSIRRGFALRGEDAEAADAPSEPLRVDDQVLPPVPPRRLAPTSNRSAGEAGVLQHRRPLPPVPSGVRGTNGARPGDGTARPVRAPLPAVPAADRNPDGTGPSDGDAQPPRKPLPVRRSGAQ